MNNLTAVANGATHQIYGKLLRVVGRRDADDTDVERDRGAVSLEQVLWFAAAGVSVAIVAGFIWQQIRDEANAPINVPAAPTP